MSPTVHLRSLALAETFELRGDDPLIACQVRIYRVKPEDLDQFVSEAAFVLSASFLPPNEAAYYPDALIGPLLPVSDSSNAERVRKGDFGEAIAQAMYQTLLNVEVPFSKLWVKPNPHTPQTGFDGTGIIVRPGESPSPIVFESKVRPGSLSPSGYLRIFEDLDNPDGLATALRRGVTSLQSHPDHENAYAYAGALGLSGLVGQPVPSADLEHHGVLICEPGNLTEAKIRQRWHDDDKTPPRRRLVVLEIPNLEDVIQRSFEAAAKFTAGDVVGRIPIVDPGPRSDPGLHALAALKLEDPNFTTTPTDWQMVVEVSLWFLARRDGIASARAVAIAESGDAFYRTLGLLLEGTIQAAVAESPTVLQSFVGAVSQAWKNPGELIVDRTNLALEAASVITNVATVEEQNALRMTAQAIGYRLDRHPERLFASSSTGSVVAGLITRLISSGRVALWPPQERAISAGLLTAAPCPFVVSMPTSSGKTILIAASCAVALDLHPDRQVVVIGDKRALVRQLQRELRRWLSVNVLALTGEIEQAGAAVFEDGSSSSRLVITTPERFDLDWRRATTGEPPISPASTLALVIADEAHHLADPGRGTRLEVSLARVLHADVPVQLFSSQLGGLEQLAEWVKGEVVDDDWAAAHTVREVFFPTGATGHLWPEGEAAAWCMDLGGRWDRSRTDQSSKKPKDISAGLAKRREPDGLVLIFSANKSWLFGLANSVKARCDDGWVPSTSLVEIAESLPDDSKEVAELLQAGIGIHHGSGSRMEHWAVECAANGGHLRFLVTTPTLLSGVDFPVRSVVVAYPHLNAQKARISAADLRNLAGRAGRGGRYTQGNLTYRAATKKEASQVRKQFADQLPPTKSQLGKAAEILRRLHANVGSLTLDDEELLAVLDSCILGVLTEAASEEANLRHELESALCRTLWWVGADDTNRSGLLDAAESRVASFRTLPYGWNRVVYRTGLGAASCMALEASLRLADRTSLRQLAVGDLVFSDDSIEIMLDAVVDTPRIRQQWKNAPDDHDTRLAIALEWVNGVDLTASQLPDAKAVEGGFGVLSNLGAWVMAAAVDICGWLDGLSGSDTSRLHASIGLDRVRWGASSPDAAKLVDGGLSRTRAQELWDSHRFSPIDFFEFVALELTESERRWQRIPQISEHLPPEVETATET